jgi:hypothetical protein
MAETAPRFAIGRSAGWCGQRAEGVLEPGTRIVLTGDRHDAAAWLHGERRRPHLASFLQYSPLESRAVVARRRAAPWLDTGTLSDGAN